MLRRLSFVVLFALVGVVSAHAQPEIVSVSPMGPWSVGAPIVVFPASAVNGAGQFNANLTDVSGTHTVAAGALVAGSDPGGATPLRVGGNSFFNGLLSFGSGGSNRAIGGATPTDGTFQFTNANGTGFGRLILGTNDATTNGIAIARDGSGRLVAVTGDGSAFVPVSASGYLASTGVSAGAGTAAIVSATTGLLAAQTANVSATNIPGASSVPAGLYQVCGWAAVTSPGTTSTLPNITITFNNGTAQTVALTLTSTGNATTTFQQACTPVRSAAAQPIKYQTGSYASTGSAMQYELYVTVTAIF